MSRLSRRTISWSLPVTLLVLIAIVAIGVFVPMAHSGAVKASAHPALAAGVVEPDRAGATESDKAGSKSRVQGNAFTKGPHGPVKSWAVQQYKIRAFPAKTIPTSGYSNATYQYNFVNDQTFSVGWAERGPNQTPNSNFFPFPLYPVQRTSVSGRATAFAVVPSTCSAGNCGTQYLGTANGGVWKSIDGGVHWSRLFDHNLQTSIGGITLDPSNPNIIYVGTGEGNFSADSQHGIGIYRSMDGGSNWTLLGANDPTDGIPNVFINRSVTRIVVDPRTAGTAHATLYVGTSSGTIDCTVSAGCDTAPGAPPRSFYFSKDGGQTWTQANPPGVGPQRITDIMIDPSNPNVLYLGVAYNGIYRTTTDGQPASGGVGTWVRLPGQPPVNSFFRVTFDFAQSTANQTPQVLYAAYDLNAGHEQIYRITIPTPQTPDGGAVFSALPNPNACSQQCSYDMPLRVDPTNPNIVYAGGQANYGFFFATDPSCATLYPFPQQCNTALMKSTDGGQTWRDISLDVNNVAIHPDDHFIWINPVDPSTVWTQNDGGNFRANSANSPNGSGTAGAVAVWNDENHGVGSLQFTGIGVSPNLSVIGGTQDNGTFITPANSTVGSHILLGDGGQGVADPFNSSVTYSEQYGATMFRFNNPTCDFQIGSYPGGYPGCGQTWIAPFAVDYFTYGGGAFYQPQTTAVRNPDGTQASNNIFHATYRLWRSQNSGGVDTNNDGDATNNSDEQLAKPSYWVPISGDLSCGPNDTSETPSCGGNITFVSVAPNDPNTVVVGTDYGNLYVTHNALAPVVTSQGTNYCPPTVFDPNVGDYVAHCNYVSGVNWTEIDGTLPGRVPTEVAFAPGSTTHYYVTMSGFGVNTPGNAYHVFETTDDGASFNPINGSGPQFSLPDMPFNSIQVNPHNGHLYVSADIGVFVSVDNGARWQRIDYALPNTPVYQLRLDPGGTQLYAATHGRGIWLTGAM